MHPNPTPSSNDPRPNTRHVVLVGLMGTGKSTVGKRLAVRLGRKFVDTDTRIEESSDRSIRSIFESDGEEAFRDMESQVLVEVLDSSEPSVIAAGGGVVVRDANRQVLRSFSVIWLRAEPTMLANRLVRSARRGASHRPLIDNDPLGKLNEMNRNRSVLYAEVSGTVIDVDGLTPDEIVERCRRFVEDSER